MDWEAFRNTVSQSNPPDGLTPALSALWHDARGDWHRAHAIVQDENNKECAWVHAYLHRKEGDASNAAYWYRLARRPVAAGDLEAEWRNIVAALV